MCQIAFSPHLMSDEILVQNELFGSHVMLGRETANVISLDAFLE